MAKPKILFWDLETSHNLAATFELYQPIIPQVNIIKERFIISGQWRWQGSRKVEAISIADFPSRLKKNRGDDYGVVKKLHEVLSEADIAIAHNGNKFDWKYFNTRCLFHKLPPVNKPLLVDTYLIARKHFKFNSNSLDYIANYLGLGRKIKTSNSWWLTIIDEKSPIEEVIRAVKDMVKYGKRDITLLQGVHDCFLSFTESYPNVSLYVDSTNPTCPKCGSEHIVKEGLVTRGLSRYQQYSCKTCKGWSRAGKAIKRATLR